MLQIDNSELTSFWQLCQLQADWFEGKRDSPGATLVPGPARDVFVTPQEVAALPKFARLHRLGCYSIDGQIGKCGRADAKEKEYYAGNFFSVMPADYPGKQWVGVDFDSLTPSQVSEYTEAVETRYKSDVENVLVYETYYLNVSMYRGLANSIAKLIPPDHPTLRFTSLPSRVKRGSKVEEEIFGDDKASQTVAVYDSKAYGTLVYVGLGKTRWRNGIMAHLDYDAGLHQQFLDDVFHYVFDCNFSAKRFCYDAFDDVLNVIERAAASVGKK